MKTKTKEITVCAVFTAILCVLAPITVQIGIIPITLGLFGVLLLAVILGAKKSLISVIIYILIGMMGLPVFSGFRGGPQVIVGPTGGYMSAYIFMCIITGMTSDRIKGDTLPDKLIIFAACIISIFVCYVFGTLQYMKITSSDIQSALALCVYPFVLIDVVKCIVAVMLGTKIRKRLQSIF